MRLRHSLAHALHQREEYKRSDGMRNEGRDDENDAREREQHGIKTEVLHAGGDALRQGMQQARGADCGAEREAAGSEDDDGPEEVVEVLFCEDAGAEEKYDGDDGDDAHVAE